MEHSSRVSKAQELVLIMQAPDTNGIPVEDLSGLSRDELFQRAFG